MDLIIILIILTVIILWRRDFKFLVYSIGILEIFFRLIHYIGDKLSVIDINSFVNKYIPSSMFDLFGKYTSDIVYDFICWGLVICFCAFLYYLVKYIIKKK